MTPSQQGYLHFCCWGWGQAGQGEQGSEQGRDLPEDAQLVGAGTGRSPTCLICPGWNQALEPLELGPRGGPHLGPASQKARKQKCKFALWEGLGETLAPASPRPPPQDTPSLMGRRWMLSGSSSSWERKILRRLRETLAYTERGDRV